MGNDSVIFSMTDSTSSVVTSFFYAISRMTEEEEEEEDQTYEGVTMSMRQMKVTEWLPRIGGGITFLSSLCMLWMAWKKRDRLFHRLVLGRISFLKLIIKSAKNKLPCLIFKLHYTTLSLFLIYFHVSSI